MSTSPGNPSCSFAAMISLSNCGCVMPSLHGLISRLICRQRDLVRQTHQLKFMVALDHAATRGHRGSAHDLQLGRSLCDSVAEYEAHCFFHAQRAGGDAEILQSLRQQLVGILVLLPGAHIRILAFRRVGQLLAGPSFLKCRAYAKCASLRGQHHRKQAFASPPLHSGKVFERSSLHQQQGVEMVGLHQLPRLFLARGPFLQP